MTASIKQRMTSRAHEVAPIAEEQIPAAGEVLARAFADDPLSVYTQPDVDARLRQFAWFFSQFVRERAGHETVYGHVSSGRLDGVAVWTPPQAAESALERDGESELAQLEERFGPESYRRFAVYGYFEDVHRQAMDEAPHWYLPVLGVDPGAQRQGIGEALLTPVFWKADQAGVPCYLETFVSDNVPFYEKRGFDVVAAGVVLEGRIPYWAMRREPAS